MRPRVSAAGSFEIWRKIAGPTRDRRGQVVRPKLDQDYMALFSWTTRFTLQESLRKGWLFDRPASIIPDDGCTGRDPARSFIRTPWSPDQVR
jgi:hypothetical protein